MPVVRHEYGAGHDSPHQCREEPLEIACVFHDDAGAANVAFHLGGLGQFDDVLPMDVALDPAVDLDGSRVDIRPDAAFLADREVLVLVGDRTFDLAFDELMGELAGERVEISHVHLGLNTPLTSESRDLLSNSV